MNEDLKKKTVCVVDNGLYVDFARKLASSFAKVYYYIPSQPVAPTTRDLVVAEGFEEVDRIFNPLEKADEIDLWVFLDIYSADLQVFLSEHGGRVWGGRKGEELELHRWEFKKTLKRLGLPVQRCWSVEGFEELTKLLKEERGLYVKSDRRGDFETWRHDSWQTSQAKVDELRHSIGPFQESYSFVVEEEIPEAVEIGYDGVTVDGQWPTLAMQAYEIKDCGMVGVVKSYSALASSVKFINEKLSDLLKRYNYRGFFSTEIRYTKEKEPFFIDPCCRLGTPSNELLQELFNGWAETLWRGAVGTMVSPKQVAKFAACAVLESEWAAGEWQAVHFSKDLDRWVKLRMRTRVGGVDYVVPQHTRMSDIGYVVGVGATMKEAIEHCKENAKGVKGFGLKAKVEALDTAEEVVEKGKKVGIQF